MFLLNHEYIYGLNQGGLWPFCLTKEARVVNNSRARTLKNLIQRSDLNFNGEAQTKTSQVISNKMKRKVLEDDNMKEDQAKQDTESFICN